MASIKEQLKAGLEVVGKTVKTVGKRIVGDESPTELSEETKKTLNIPEKKKAGKNAASK